MDIKCFKIILLSCFVFASPISGAENAPDEDLIKFANLAYDLRRAAKRQDTAIQAVRDAMAQLSDAEKTRALALRIFEVEKRDGKMRFTRPFEVSDVMLADPTLIKDPTELKAMIRQETDPRKFFLLAAMANQLVAHQKADFIPAFHHMLFIHGAYGRVEGEYYYSHYWDVSLYAYDSIIAYLKILNADYPYSPQDKVTPEKILELAKWLKAHWPGCEDLEIPQAALDGKIPDAEITPKPPEVQH